MGKTVAKMVLVLLCVHPVACQSRKGILLSSDSIALAPPLILVDSLLFKDSASVKMILGQDESIIRYTTDGSEVTQNALVYERPLQLLETAQLRAKAFHPYFNASGEVEVNTKKIVETLTTSEIAIAPNPHKNYQGKGASTLVDTQKGSFNFRKGEAWLGFQDTTITISLHFAEAKTLQNIAVSLLKDQDSWIFLPKAISVSTENTEIGYMDIDDCDTKDIRRMGFYGIDLPKKPYTELDIHIMAMNGIPDWHPGKGTPPWTFIDEILIE